MHPANLRQIRAVYNDKTIRVYQAFNDQIANSALANGKFVSPPFSLGRMSWIKPSFLWMMYRSGWAGKDEGQKRVLAIDLSREGFEEILSQGLLSMFEANLGLTREEWQSKLSSGDVRIQWDPERSLNLDPLEYRSIQIGLRGKALENYAVKWIDSITDITETVHDIHQIIKAGRKSEAQNLLPKE